MRESHGDIRVTPNTIGQTRDVRKSGMIRQSSITISEATRLKAIARHFTH